MKKEEIFIYAGNIRAGGAVKRLYWELYYLAKNKTVQLHVRISKAGLEHIKNINIALLDEITIEISHENALKELIYWQLIPGSILHLGRFPKVYSVSGILPLTPPKKSFKIISPSSVLPFEINTTIGSFTSKTNLKRILMGYLAKRSLKNADAIVFLSSYMDTLTAPLRSQAFKHLSIHPIYPNEKVTAKTCYNLIRPNCISLLYVSHIADYKDQLWLISQLDTISHYLEIDIDLKLVGDVDSNLKKKFDSVKKKSFNNLRLTHIDKLPFQELDAIYQQCDCILFGSKSENSPHTLLEGIQRGIPIICRDRQFNHYYVRDEGIYYDDFDTLLDCIRSISTSASNRRLIGERTLSLIKNHQIANILPARCDFITSSEILDDR